MAKYLIIQDFEVSTKLPNGQSQLVVFPKDNVIDAAISPIDNKLVTTPSGELPDFKSVGQVLVPVDTTKVKLIAEPKSDDMKKWLYLGGTALLLWWFIYGRDRKQKYDSTPAGYAGIRGKKGTKGDIYEYVIPTYALPYLVNNDPSGLSDEEIEKIDKFADGVYKETGASIEMGIDYEQQPYFKWRNDIDGSIGADVIDVKIRSKK
jgi:hypothetical protein